MKVKDLQRLAEHYGLEYKHLSKAELEEVVLEALTKTGKSRSAS